MNNSYNPWNTPGYNYPQYPYGMSQQMNPQMPSNVNAPRVNTISGRVVSSPNEITPNEIPMDGSVSLFPTSDYSTIYAKAWNTNGQIETVKFVVSKPEEVTTEKSDGDLNNVATTIGVRNCCDDYDRITVTNTGTTTVTIGVNPVLFVSRRS